MLPIRTQPEADETLSSWVVRCALDHSAITHAFSRAHWRGVQVWNRDLDVFAPRRVVERMATLTGCSIERAWRTTFYPLQGTLLEEVNDAGQLPWILKAGIYHRTRRRFGQQYCPRCLATDPMPYFRRAWRLAFVAVCPRHRCVLADRCPSCNCPVVPHRAADAFQTLIKCAFCGTKLTTAPSPPANPSAVELQLHLEAAALKGWVLMPDNSSVHAIPYFKSVRQIAKLVLTGRRSSRLRRALEQRFGVSARGFMFPSARRQVEFLSSHDRHRLLENCAPLLFNWPNNFVRVMREAEVWHSWVLKDIENDVPYMLWRVVRDHLYRQSYVPNRAELLAAGNYMKKRGQRPTALGLQRLLGSKSKAHGAISLELAATFKQASPFKGSRRVPRAATSRHTRH